MNNMVKKIISTTLALTMIAGAGFCMENDKLGFENTAITASADGIYTSSSLGNTLLQNGSRGDLVVVTQALLNRKSGAGLTVDGIFGSKTKAAVKNFQRSNGLAVDGIVGPQTWKALFRNVRYVNVNFNLRPTIILL